MTTLIRRFFAMLGLVLAGCTSVPRVPSTDTALVDFCATVEYSLLVTARPHYTLVSVDLAYLSLTDAQIQQMMAYCDRRLHKAYLDEIWDCDDIAREYRGLANRWAIESFKPKPPAAVAMATLLLKVNGRLDGIHDYGAGGRHAMVAVRRVDGTWFLIEPAFNKRAPLRPFIWEGCVEVEYAEL